MASLAKTDLGDLGCSGVPDDDSAFAHLRAKDWCNCDHVRAWREAVEDALQAMPHHGDVYSILRRALDADRAVGEEYAVDVLCSSFRRGL